MKFLTITLMLLLAGNAFADETFISNVSLKIDGGNASPHVQCFVNESLKQVFPEYTLSKIAYSTIDKAGLPEDENLNASIHFLATHNTTGKLEQFAITLAAFDEANKWNYVQGEISIYPFSSKVSDVATTGRKNSGEMPSYLPLAACK